MNQLPFTVEQRSRNFHVVRVDAKRNNDWNFEVNLRSDAHHDHAKCNQSAERRHLEEAKVKNAGIIDAGDLFCAMQGKYDPRKSYNDLRPEYKQDHYLDSLVEKATEFYAPYANNIIVLGRGNHEGSILERNGTDLTGNLAMRLTMESGKKVFTSGYSGYVKFIFNDGHAKGSFASKLLWFFHGSGGGGPVTRDVLNVNRLAVFNPDPDIIFTGHTHDSWIMSVRRMRVSGNGRVFQDYQHHIKTPTYKNEFNDGYGGWSVTKGHPPKPMGSVWMKFTWDRELKDIVTTFTPALV